MLEKMRDFFEARLDGYDEHMMTNIESATAFYPFTAKMLPVIANCHILDIKTPRLIQFIYSSADFAA